MVLSSSIRTVARAFHGIGHLGIWASAHPGTPTYSGERFQEAREGAKCCTRLRSPLLRQHMASSTSCLASLQRRVVCSAIRPVCQRRLQFCSTPLWQTRQASGSSKYNSKKDKDQEKKKRKARTTFVQYDLRDAEQFALCDAMR